MLTEREVISTLDMLRSEHLDVRTVTLGLNLFDCASDNFDTFAYRVRSKINRHAKNLVAICNEVGDRYGIPVVNKRITVSPIGTVCAGYSRDQMVKVCKLLDDCATDAGVDFLGGFGALVEKGITPGERNLTAATADRDGLGCCKLVVFCNIPEDVPFMAGGYLGVGEADAVISVGVSGPGVVKKAIDRAVRRRGEQVSITEIAEIIKTTAFKVTKVGQLIGTEVAEKMNLPFGVADLSLAPTPEVGDSVGEIFQSVGLSSIGAPGSTAVLAMLNDAVKKGGVFASSSVGGLSGAFIPVSEDAAIADAAAKGLLTLEKLEAMTCVCSVGLDMIAIPGDTPADVISAIIADESAIGMINAKTTAVRLIPVPGKTVGERAEFGGLLGGADIMAVQKGSAAGFINRGGRIPAPIHSFKN